MKSIICIFTAILMLANVPTFAQQSHEQLDHINKIEKSRKMKKTGTTLTVLGGVLVVVGAVTMYNSSYNWWTGEEEGNLEAGAICTVIGIGGLASGIPLWAVGAHNERKANDKLKGLSVRLKVNTRSTGFALSYRF